MEERVNTTDHDLLIRTDAKVDGLTGRISELGADLKEIYGLMRGFGESIDAKIQAAVAHKLDRSEFDETKKTAEKLHQDHERRIRFIERSVWIGMGALALLQIILKVAG